MASIYVAGLPEDIDRSSLELLFAQFGAISSVQVFPPTTGELGYGFVNFESMESVEAAIREASCIIVGSSKLKVRFKGLSHGASTVKRTCGEAIDTSHDQHEKKSLHISDLPTSMDEEKLLELFHSFKSDIRSVHIKNTREGFRYAFMNFCSANRAHKAMFQVSKSNPEIQIRFAKATPIMDSGMRCSHHDATTEQCQTNDTGVRPPDKLPGAIRVPGLADSKRKLPIEEYLDKKCDQLEKEREELRIQVADLQQHYNLVERKLTDRQQECEHLRARAAQAEVLAERYKGAIAELSSCILSLKKANHDQSSTSMQLQDALIKGARDQIVALEHQVEQMSAGLNSEREKKRIEIAILQQCGTHAAKATEVIPVARELGCWLTNEFPKLYEGATFLVPVLALRWSQAGMNAGLEFGEGHEHSRDSVFKLIDKLVHQQVTPEGLTSTSPLDAFFHTGPDGHEGLYSRHNRRLVALLANQILNRETLQRVWITIRPKYDKEIWEQRWLRAYDGTTGLEIRPHPSRDSCAKHRGHSLFKGDALRTKQALQRVADRGSRVHQPLNALLAQLQVRPSHTLEDEETLTLVSVEGTKDHANVLQALELRGSRWVPKVGDVPPQHKQAQHSAEESGAVSSDEEEVLMQSALNVLDDAQSSADTNLAGNDSAERVDAVEGYDRLFDCIEDFEKRNSSWALASNSVEDFSSITNKVCDDIVLSDSTKSVLAELQVQSEIFDLASNHEAAEPKVKSCMGNHKSDLNTFLQRMMGRPITNKDCVYSDTCIGPNLFQSQVSVFGMRSAPAFTGKLMPSKKEAQHSAAQAALLHFHRNLGQFQPRANVRLVAFQ